MQRKLMLIPFLGLCLGIGGLGAATTVQEIPGWYRSLTKPGWNPPDAVFGPVWTVLYCMMGTSAWLIWAGTDRATARRPLAVFGVQLILNAAWSWIFFGCHQPGWALAEIVLLWMAIVATIRSFWPISPLAAGLLIPYLGWVSFATILNAAIWRLNPA